MQQALPLRRFAEQCLCEGAGGIRVDLRDCTYLDSTFLGTLLHLRRAARRRGSDLTLVAPSAECRRLLQQIGVEDAFPIQVMDETAAPAWQDLDPGKADARAFNQTVVEAHQELASLGGRAGETFQPVAECLNREWEEQQRRE
jgi:anti-anti-sigma factor